jgi:hypothetical protein
MTTDFPMFTMLLSIRLTSGCTAAGAVVAGWGAAGAGWPPVGFTASSRFHMSCPPPCKGA